LQWRFSKVGREGEINKYSSFFPYLEHQMVFTQKSSFVLHVLNIIIPRLWKATIASLGRLRREGR